MLARVSVTLKSGVLDPQGKAIGIALHSLGIEAIDSVRQGKLFDIDVRETDPVQAEIVVRTACERLLANLVIESYEITFPGSAP